MKKIILILFIVLLTNCVQQGAEKTLAASFAPEPENLPEYFQQLLMDSANYCLFYDEMDSEKIFRSLRLLQDFVDGKVDNYPTWSVREALGNFALHIIKSEAEGYCYDPNKEECTFNCLTNFMEAYMDQVFRLCPDFSLLLSLVSDDGKIGIFNFNEFKIPYPLISYSAPTYIIYKDDNEGYKKIFWCEGFSYERLYQIDRNGERYYLLVNIAGHFEPNISLISLSEDGIRECLQPISADVGGKMQDIYYSKYSKNEFPEPVKLIFNPKDLTWKECQMYKNGYWAEFPGSKTFRLVLGDKNYIQME